ncbi:MAG: hypothetical protein FWD15_05600 [Alphaproteobacteria bacterium]|nr:hypothetical protein [Alphaproteobacteria bacterium]
MSQQPTQPPRRKRGAPTQGVNPDHTGNIGDMTFDNDRAYYHDGATSGGRAIAYLDDLPDLSKIDYIVESAHNLSGPGYTRGWYKIYKSGWAEIGGMANAIPGLNDTITVVLPFNMPIENRTVFLTPQRNDVGWATANLRSQAINNIQLKAGNAGSGMQAPHNTYFLVVGHL